MKLTRTLSLTLCAGVALAMSGCLMSNTGTLQEATLPVLQSKYTVLGDRVSGTDSTWRLWSLPLTPLRSGSPALRALYEAKAKIPETDGLVEVSQNTEVYLYPIFFFVIQRDVVRVTGTPVKVNSLK